MRTGSVTVAGEVTKIDMVSSSKLLMKASSQPPAQPHAAATRKRSKGMPIRDLAMTKTVHGRQRLISSIGIFLE